MQIQRNTFFNKIADLVRSFEGISKSPDNAKIDLQKKDDFKTEKIEDQKYLEERLIELSKDLNEDMKRLDTTINFDYNAEIKGFIVTVKDGDGHKVIRQIPSEEAIGLMVKVKDILGNIFDKKA